MRIYKIGIGLNSYQPLDEKYVNADKMGYLVRSGCVQYDKNFDIIDIDYTGGGSYFEVWGEIISEIKSDIRNKIINKIINEKRG
jgi:hypothetical protein